MPTKISIGYEGGSSDAPAKKKTPAKSSKPTKKVSTAGTGDPHSIQPAATSTSSSRKRQSGVKNFETFQ
jgi:hypothetical protein